MSKILIVYGSTTWNNQAIAEWIEEILSEEGHEISIWDWSEFDASDVKDFDFSFIWSSTWWDWDIQDDMVDFVEDLRWEDLSWIKIAVYWNWMSSFPQFCKAADEIEKACIEAWAEMVWDSLKIDWDVYDAMDDAQDWAKNLVS